MAKDKHGTRFNGIRPECQRRAARRRRPGRLLGVSDATIDPDIAILINRIKENGAALEMYPQPGRPVDTDLYLQVLTELVRAGIPLRDWNQSRAHKHITANADDREAMGCSTPATPAVRKMGLKADAAQSILRRLVDLRDNKTPAEWRTPRIT